MNDLPKNKNDLIRSILKNKSFSKGDMSSRIKWLEENKSWVEDFIEVRVKSDCDGLYDVFLSGEYLVMLDEEEYIRYERI